MTRMLWLLAAAPLLAGAEGGQQFFTIPEFPLEGGGVIRECRIGYRTYGRLAADKENAVLFPTWFTGSSRDLEPYFGTTPDRMVDTTRYFAIAVDALANGVSSSPSNSAAHPRLAFPRITVRDMVNSQRRLIMEVFGIKKLHAVIGISMGGMQTFQWAVSYPGMMERAIPIVGTPQLTSTDLLLWTAELKAIEENKDYNGGRYAKRPEIQALSLLHAFALTTPQYRAARTSRGQFRAWLKEAIEREGGFDPNDRVRQLEAMIAHDVGAPFRGSLARAAAEVRARMLILVAARDHMVNPSVAIEFGKLVRAPAVSLDGDCGHLIFECQSEALVPKVTEFLRQGEPRKPLLERIIQ